MLSRRLLPWLFALALMLGQAAAFAHALTHLHTDDSTLHDKVCEVCVAQAQLGGGVPPSVHILAIPSGDPVVSRYTARLRVDLAPLPACARAPPTPLNS
ncbi:MAG: hypothetical protein GZ085_00035 [Sulfuriferula multivorans]|uniref:DUF2946 domain-containing protein n=1 Tax=Sulfuriferula multivorans TaxID=1559896 RepID=A0A7C9NSH7_9PROT|nr:hypothetical protein [Sulfuriferula multivorans]